MGDVAGQLRRAGDVRAAHGNAVRIPLHRRGADRAQQRDRIGHGSGGALFPFHPQDFRDDLPCLADFNGIADADILFGDEILVM